MDGQGDRADAPTTGGGTTTTTTTATPQQWAALYEWSAAQTWGPNSLLSSSQQFQRYIDKLRELGLPIGNPTR